MHPSEYAQGEGREIFRIIQTGNSCFYEVMELPVFLDREHLSMETDSPENHGIHFLLRAVGMGLM